MSLSTTYFHHHLDAIITATVFSFAGGILGLLCINLNNVNNQTISRAIIYGSLIGLLGGGIIGFLIARVGRIAHRTFSVKPIPANKILVGQFLGLLEGMCIGLFPPDLPNAMTGALVGWIVGALVCGSSWIIDNGVRNILLIVVIQSIIELIAGLFIDFFVLCVIRTPFTLILDGILTVCYTIGFYRMWKNEKHCRRK